MSTTYAWSFPQFEVAPSEDGLTDVVRIIHWRLCALDGEFKAATYGTTALGAPNPNAFTPYADITAEWAIDAVSADVNVVELEAALAGEIAQQKSPSVVPMQPPF